MKKINVIALIKSILFSILLLLILVLMYTFPHVTAFVLLCIISLSLFILMIFGFYKVFNEND